MPSWNGHSGSSMRSSVGFFVLLISYAIFGYMVTWKIVYLAAFQIFIAWVTIPSRGEPRA